MAILSQRKRESYGFSVPVIVTTAKLNVCKFDPTAVSLGDGLVGDASYEVVPWIRFRKAFLPDDLKSELENDFGEVGLRSERTVLVVNAENLIPLLKIAEATLPPYSDSWPWSAGRFWSVSERETVCGCS